MMKDGFLRFCDDPEIACCKGEAELAKYRATGFSPKDITQMQAELQKYRQAEAEGRLIIMAPDALVAGWDISSGEAKAILAITFFPTREEAERKLHGPCHGCKHCDTRFDNPCVAPCTNYDHYERSEVALAAKEGGGE